MAKATLDSVYRRFCEIYANSHPIRGVHDVDAAVRAAGLGYAEVGDEWFRSLRRKWVDVESEEPFADERANREYRRLASI